MIISPQEFAEYKYISSKYDEDKVKQAIKDGQSDLLQEFGSFYYDIQRNLENEEYKDLLEGSDFELDGVQMYHEGIKSLLADYAYARYLYNININHSPHGLVNKTSNNSEPVDRNIIRDLVKQANIDANRKLERIKDYLKTQNFRVYNRCNTSTSNNIDTIRFSFLSTKK